MLRGQSQNELEFRTVTFGDELTIVGCHLPEPLAPGTDESRCGRIGVGA